MSTTNRTEDQSTSYASQIIKILHEANSDGHNPWEILERAMDEYKQLSREEARLIVEYDADSIEEATYLFGEEHNLPTKGIDYTPEPDTE